MSPRIVVVASLLVSSLAACSHGSDRPPPSQPSNEASLYNEPSNGTSSDRAADTQAQLVAAQVRITTVIGQALRVGAAIWLAQKPTCPTPDDILAAHLVSDQLRSKDAWDNPYRITCDTKDPLVTSAGPDGVFGTADDIVVGLPAK